MNRKTNRVKRAWEIRHQKGWANLKPDRIILAWIKKYRSRMGRAVVDLGCGSGRFLVPLAKMGFDVTGVELTDTAIRQLKARLAKARLSATVVQGDFRRVRLPEHGFDCALAIQSFQLGNWSSVKRSFSGVARMLKPGGLFFLRVRSMRNIPARVKFEKEKHDLPKALRGVTYDRTYDTGESSPNHHYSRAELDYLARANGFEIVEGPTECRSKKKMALSACVTSQWNVLMKRTRSFG